MKKIIGAKRGKKKQLSLMRKNKKRDALKLKKKPKRFSLISYAYTPSPAQNRNQQQEQQLWRPLPYLLLLHPWLLLSHSLLKFPKNHFSPLSHLPLQSPSLSPKTQLQSLPPQLQLPPRLWTLRQPTLNSLSNPDFPEVSPPSPSSAPAAAKAPLPVLSSKRVPAKSSSIIVMLRFMNFLIFE